jgi:5-methylcytosine-specific restriction protein A
VERLRTLDKRRPGPRRRGYDSEWERYREDYLRRHPSCADCGAQSTVVDHIRPVKDGGSFWDPNNHQPMCGTCHAAKTARDVNARMRLWA